MTTDWKRHSLLALCGIGLALTASADSARSTVELDGITRIHLLGPYTLNLRQSDQESVTIITEEDFMDEVEARIKGDTLVLGEKRRGLLDWFDVGRNPKVTFEVAVRDLDYLANRGSGRLNMSPFVSEELEIALSGSGELQGASLDLRELQLTLSGSGTVELQELRAEETDFNLQGSGDIQVARVRGVTPAARLHISGHGSGDVRVAGGDVREVDIRLNGSGDIDLSELVAERVSVGINGSGDVAVYASEVLDVSVNGSGDVRYYGEPRQVDTSTNGSGDVEPAQ